MSPRPSAQPTSSQKRFLSLPVMGAMGMLTGKTWVKNGGKVVVVVGVDDGEAKGKCRARVSLAADSGANRTAVTVSLRHMRLCHAFVTQ